MWHGGGGGLIGEPCQLLKLKIAFPRLLLLSQPEHVSVALLPGFGDVGQGVADLATGISARTPCPAIMVIYPLDTPAIKIIRALRSSKSAKSPLARKAAIPNWLMSFPIASTTPGPFFGFRGYR